MAAGTKAGKVNIGAVEQALGALFDGVTYSHVRMRAVSGVVLMGPTGVTLSTGVPLEPEQFHTIERDLTAAGLFFIGNGVLEFFGIATA